MDKVDAESKPWGSTLSPNPADDAKSSPNDRREV
jgi:hypothetical protein